MTNQQKTIFLFFASLGLLSAGAVAFLNSSRVDAPAANEDPVASLEQSLVGKTAYERAVIKSSSVAALTGKQIFSRSKYSIQITDIQAADKTLHVYARVSDVNGQIGFGPDGTVDIEHFVITNPPIMVADPSGTIVRTFPNSKGPDFIAKYRIDPQEAVLQVIEQAVDVKKQKFGPENIVPGKIGNTTLTVYPDADPETSTVDGAVERQGTDATWAAARDTADGLAFTDDSTGNWISGGGDAGATYYVFRGMFLFDTSSIGSGSTISSATISFFGFQKLDTDSQSMHVVSANPASNTALALGDYDTNGSTSFGSITIASFSTTGYNDISLNASGIANISKTSISKFGTRHDNDINNNTPTGDNAARARFAEQAGSTEDPKLVVEYSAAAVDPNNGGTILEGTMIIESTVIF